jgi:mRNA interferase RelE/StbE
VSYAIKLAPAALDMLRQFTDHRVRAKLAERIDGLAENPAGQGKPLTGQLHGLRSVRAVGQRYRIIYKVEEDRIIIVLIVALGLRKAHDKKDIYELAKKLIKARLVE